MAADLPANEQTTLTAEPSGIQSPVDIIREILSPKLSIADPDVPYKAPVAVMTGDVDALQELDERKLIELKEVGYIYVIELSKIC